MAVALNGTQETLGLTTGGTPTFNITVPSGTTTMVLLVLSKSTASTSTMAVSASVDGAAVFEKRATSPSALAPLLRSAACVWQSPTSGAQTITVTHGAAPTGTNAGTRVVCVYLNGTDTAQVFESTGGPLTDNNSGAGTVSNVSVTVVGYADGAIVCGCAHEGASIMSAKGADQTGAGGDADGFIDEGNWNSAFTYELTPSAGSNAQTFTNGASDTTAVVAVAFAAGAVVAEVIPSLVMAPLRA